MKFGIFDHLDANDLPLADLFENRLKLIEAYERIGIYAYHLAEHHATPLGMAPAPSVFLSAVAQRTTRLLFGPMVYTLALYHPLRLAEEVCMLDHLSRGRLQLGIGRGVSPIELQMFGVDASTGRERYFETYQVLLKALGTKMLSHQGEFYKFTDVPIAMAPLQKPHPPMWYGVPVPAACEWAAQNAINVVSLRPPGDVTAIVARYREEWAKLGKPAASIPMMGMARHIVIAETDEEALRIGRRAYRRWRESFFYLWVNHNKLGVTPPSANYPPELDQLIEQRQAYIGTPAKVRAELQAEVRETGVNYAMLDFAFGDLKLEESLRSVDLFARHVMPAFN